MRRPERRNRKSGTKDFGWRAQNKMGIPNSWQDRDGEDRVYAERLAPETIERIDVNGHEITFIREPTRDGAHHACSTADVVHLLSLVPERDLEDLDIVAFRQPTRKQAAHQHCWGRLFYYANIAKVEGSAIVLEAMDLPSPLPVRRSMNIEQ